ncbi:MAG: MotA/TolQ/ExbB proton channel family protein [Candidatus Tectimicrobiota bacterium]
MMAEVATLAQTVLQWGIVAMLVKGGLVMIPLLAASLLSTTVMIERGLFWRRLRRQAVDHTIVQYVAAGQLEQATKIASESAHPIARVLYAGLESRHHEPGMAMEAAAPRDSPGAVYWPDW